MVGVIARLGEVHLAFGRLDPSPDPLKHLVVAADADRVTGLLLQARLMSQSVEKLLVLLRGAD